MKKGYRVLAAVVFLMALLSNCATVQPPFLVKIDSIKADSSAGKKTYILLPGNKNTSPDELQFREFSGYVHRALSAQGFKQASSFEEADLAIFVVYGIGDPQEHQYTYSLPVWGQTGVSSSTTFGTLSTYGGLGTYSGTTVYTPTYGTTGYTTHVETYTTYPRYMLLDAYDLNVYRKEKKEVQSWKTTVTSTGSSDDLRRVFPVLAAASKQYIGSNTGRKVEIQLYETDSAVIEIKGVVVGQSEVKK